jgi:hypothetical protein
MGFGGDVRLEALKKSLLQTVGFAALAGLMSWAGFVSLKFGWADYRSHQNDLSARLEALRLTPGDADAWLRLAELKREAGQDGRADVRRAVALNPSNYEALILVGLGEESAGNTSEAEHDLLAAARMDKDYLPRWTLANFYFRQGNLDALFQWANDGLVVAVGDVTGLFRLLWTATDDGQRILATIPEREHVRIQYLTWLTDQGRLAAGVPVAADIVARWPLSGKDAAVYFVERLALKGDVEDATRLWNVLAVRSIVPTRIDPFAGQSLVNSDFRTAPLNRGLDWHLISVDGVRTEFTRPGMRFEFSGHEAEQCDLMQQLSVLAPGRKYRFNYSWEGRGIEAGTGLRWRIMDAIAGAEITGPTPDIFGSGGNGAFQFAVPQNVGLCRISLRYTRRPGTLRIEGWIRILNTRLSFAE